MDSVPYVVIGAGLAGASAAWHVAAAGHQVLVLEQQDQPAGPLGSSHGSARIFRHTYPERFYVDLLKHAEPLWDQLEASSGQQLKTTTGGVDFGAPRNPRHLASVLKTAGVEHELVGAAEAQDRWPQLQVDSDVLWQPQAGVIDAVRTAEAMLHLATQAGATMRLNWAVESITKQTPGYLIRSSTGEQVQAEHIIITAGGWLPQLLGRIDLPRAFTDALPQFQVRQEQAYHFPYRDQQLQWPTLVHQNQQILVYGLPGGRDAEFKGQKVAEFNGGKRIASAAEQDGIVAAENRRRVVDYVSANLPGLIPEPYAETTCLFTNTAAEDFVFDRCENITVVSPCSGHGAKFAPLIGQLAASAATAPDDSSGRARLPARFRVA